jgi:organic hydroperoxide reductase OsmC/OhrA
MTEHMVKVVWERGNQPFSDNKYSRAHQWCFDGGAVVQGSSSPSVVPLPYSVEHGVDPEEAYVAALSACHMLWFLDLARRDGCIVDRYVDQAVGCMTRSSDGNMWISRVELNPDIHWAAPQPTADAVRKLHHAAHDNCFIANSVKTEVTVT